MVRLTADSHFIHLPLESNKSILKPVKASSLLQKWLSLSYFVLIKKMQQPQQVFESFGLKWNHSSSFYRALSFVDWRNVNCIWAWLKHCSIIHARVSREDGEIFCFAFCNPACFQKRFEFPWTFQLIGFIINRGIGCRE